jgi:MerR family transcriptional regulator, light-induced transcriptional regulator
MASPRQLAAMLSTFSTCEEASSGILGSRDDGSKPLLAESTSQSLNHVFSNKHITLARTIETEIIPRLMMAHRMDTALAPGAAPSRLTMKRSPSHADVAELTRLVLEHDQVVARSMVDTLHGEGISVEALYIELLAPAARLMGRMWSDDIVDFTEVTHGLFRLQQLFHDLAPAFEIEGKRQSLLKGSVLLAPTPGEQHTFGLLVLEEFLRRTGLACKNSMPKTLKALTSLVREDHFDVVGLTASCDQNLDSVSSSVKAIKKASRNKYVTVLVGGSIFVDNPSYVALVGADGTARDGRDAALQLRNILDTRLTHTK